VIANFCLWLHTDAMPRKLIKRWMPDHEKIRQQKCLRFLGNCLHNPSLWNLNRHSVAGAFFIGLFCAFMPIPLQMVLAAVLAVMFNVNIPVSVALVWLTNPLTMPPLFYFAYEVGEWVLGQPDNESFSFEPNLEWMLALLQNNWQPFILGCLITGITLGALGFFAIHLLWRGHVTHRWVTRPGRFGIPHIIKKTESTLANPRGATGHAGTQAVSPKASSSSGSASGSSTVSGSHPDSVRF